MIVGEVPTEANKKRLNSDQKVCENEKELKNGVQPRELRQLADALWKRRELIVGEVPIQRKVKVKNVRY